MHLESVMACVARLLVGVAASLCPILSVVASVGLTEGVPPRSPVSYLGSGAVAAYADPSHAGNGWGRGLRLLLSPEVPATDRLDRAITEWVRLAQAGDTRSARAVCHFGRVYRLGYRAVDGRKGSPTLGPAERLPFCTMAADGAYGTYFASLDSGYVCGRAAARRKDKARCRADHVRRIYLVKRWPVGWFSRMGSHQWMLRRYTAALDLWSRGSELGDPRSMVLGAYAHFDDHGGKLFLRVRATNALVYAHHPEQRRRWNRRWRLLERAAWTGEETAMLRHAEAQVARIAQRSKGGLRWSYRESELDAEFPLTPAERMVGGYYYRGMSRLHVDDTAEKLRSQPELRVEALAWLSLVVAFTADPETLAGAGLYRPVFARHLAEPHLVKLRSVSTAAELARVQDRQREILRDLGPGLVVWDD